MDDFALPVPLEEQPQDAAANPTAALMALARQQQQRREEALARLRGLSEKQAGEAGQLRSMAFLSSLGQNPLLQGLQREAGQQGAQLQGMAAQAEARADTMDRSGLDPLGIARLQQLAEYQKGQQDIAAQKLEQQKKEAAAKAAAGAAAMAAKAAKKAEEDALKLETGLRKEFMGQKPVEEYFKAANAYDKVLLATEDPSAAGDLALIFGYMKVLDPGSVVKETEFANAQNAAGVPDRIRNAWNKALSGERLNPDQRAEFARSAQAQFAAHEAQYDAFADRYRSLAPEGRGGRVVMERPKQRGTPPASKQQAAQPTTQRTPITQALPPGPGGSLLLGPPPAAAPMGDFVRVISPDGKVGRIPRANLEKAKAKGYKEAE